MGKIGEEKIKEKKKFALGMLLLMYVLVIKTWCWIGSWLNEPV